MKTLFFLPLLFLALITFSCEREDGRGPTTITFLDAGQNTLSSPVISAAGAEAVTFYIEVNNVLGVVNVPGKTTLSVDNGVSTEVPHEYYVRRSSTNSGQQTNRLFGISLPVGTDELFADAETAIVTVKLQDRNNGGDVTRELMIRLD